MRRFILTLSFCLCSLLSAISANAQAVGSISGHVADVSSALVPGATVTAINQGTNAERTAKADSGGYFALPLLPIGTYTVRIVQPGFQTFELKNASLEGQQNLQLDIKLRLADVNATVNVEAEQTNTVQRADSTLGQTIHAEQVANLPLNGRDFAQLALLTPGTTRGEQTTDFLNQGTSSEVSFRGSVSLSVQGMPENTNDWRLDGVDDNELTGGGVAFLPQVDAIQEFNVLTFNYSAQYGSRGGSTILVSTKSGTNQFHGSA